MLTPKSKIFYEDEECIIENYKIEELCEKVEMAQDEDGDFIMPVIFSKVVINARKENGDKVDIPLEVQTKYSDVEYMNLDSTSGIENLS